MNVLTLETLFIEIFINKQLEFHKINLFYVIKV